MPHEIDPFQAHVARIALAAAQEYGFVLGGGLALLAHGVVSRPTEDIDLFSDRPEGAGVPAAAARVRTALESAGIRVRTQEAESSVGELIAGLDEQIIELVAARGDADPDGVRLSLGYLHRRRGPVMLDVGPVMHLDDLRAWKVAALVARAEPRDFIDVAAFLESADARQLLKLARTMDPDIEDEDVVRIPARLDRIPDRELAGYGLDAAAVARLRRQFSGWPGMPPPGR
ncbi:nucleotidyl transferase AbiEii/AbiGii toxin family protein [Plantactinospora siamensis]|uniref:Nucleotidyl transferase AbiEii/AbiGii toxin family protein n=1 Tax=Plantactinospora siamensis TaxID=555372 RepID=A0ABV6NZD4_9ACTN